MSKSKFKEKSLAGENNIIWGYS